MDKNRPKKDNPAHKPIVKKRKRADSDEHDEHELEVPAQGASKRSRIGNKETEPVPGPSRVTAVDSVPQSQSRAPSSGVVKQRKRPPQDVGEEEPNGTQRKKQKTDDRRSPSERHPSEGREVSRVRLGLVPLLTDNKGSPFSVTRRGGQSRSDCRNGCQR